MKKIQFVEEIESQEDGLVKMTEEKLLKIIRDGLIDAIGSYEIPESFILKYHELIDKSIILNNLSLSEWFIKEAIDIEYLTIEDIYNLNMKTYSNLSDRFILKYKNNINWERMIIYLSACDKDISIYADIIEKNNLWKIISANDLPIDFIRKNKSKLDWSILSIIKDFSEEEISEFSDLFPDKKEFDYNFPTITVDEIRNTLPKNLFTNPKVSISSPTSGKDEIKFEVKHKMDNLSPEELSILKQMIKNQEI